ncbi:hypothetical protein ABZW47_31210 [Streptomyces sp. NPDC004549]|uniref:hypothetical protein n=1 Tax=Streptomyces sp. NPDC004549 TaxID=3154283 RepID=UPI0033A95A22
MTPSQRTRTRAGIAATLTGLPLTLVLTGALHRPGTLICVLLALTATLGAITAAIALASVFAPTTATRTAARHTLDLLLRLVPWYTPRS